MSNQTTIIAAIITSFGLVIAYNWVWFTETWESFFQPGDVSFGMPISGQQNVIRQARTDGLLVAFTQGKDPVKNAEIRTGEKPVREIGNIPLCAIVASHDVAGSCFVSEGSYWAVVKDYGEPGIVEVLWIPIRKQKR